MGTDKSSILYREEIHRAYLANLLLEVGCQKVYLSCSLEQSKTMSFEYPVITDNYPNVGPIGGVLSALEWSPMVAWLVLGCDYALLDIDVLQQLVDGRRANADATVFRHPESQYLEPLVAIYEPKAYPTIKLAFTQGTHSLRKILQTLDVNDLTFNKPHKLMNVNTPEEKLHALKYLIK